MMRAMSQTSSPWMHPTLTFTLPNQAATEAMARLLARFAVVGDLIRLEGGLGAGKTTFATAFLQALGHVGEVPSPTYTLVQTYEDTRLPVAHVDCYRLNDPAELDALGLEDYRKGGLLLVEWPEKGGALVAAGQPDLLGYHINNPDNAGTLTITLAAGDTADARIVTLTASPSWQHRYGLFPQGALPVTLARPVTAEGRETFVRGTGKGGFTISPLAPEWSFRSYWRVNWNEGASSIVMDAPPPFEGIAAFAKVSEYYASVGLKVADIQARDDADGYLLSEDLGSLRLLELVQQGGDEQAWYGVAVDVLTRLCQNEPPAWGRRYTAKDWFIETARFPDWAMPLARGRQTSPEERAHFASLWQPLFAKVMAMPTGLLPWDYQATNMMILGEEPCLANFGLIDIQDARVAPICQDLAILLRDIRRGQNDALEAAMLERAAATLQLNPAHLREAVDIANFQHCVRIIGGLARSALRDGNWKGAVAFMARTWEVMHQSYGCPALAPLVELIAPLEVPMMDAVTQRGLKAVA